MNKRVESTSQIAARLLFKDLPISENSFPKITQFLSYNFEELIKQLYYTLDLSITWLKLICETRAIVTWRGIEDFMFVETQKCFLAMIYVLLLQSYIYE